LAGFNGAALAFQEHEGMQQSQNRDPHPEPVLPPPTEDGSDGQFVFPPLDEPPPELPDELPVAPPDELLLELPDELLGWLPDELPAAPPDELPLEPLEPPPEHLPHVESQ
jgi:hypothetical protein